LKKAKHNGFDVVFLTHDCEHAQKALKYGAFDFLIKPITTVEMDKTLLIYRVKHNEMQKGTANTLKAAPQFSPLTLKKKILTEVGKIYFDPNEIVCLNVEGKKTWIILKNNLQYLACFSMITVLEILDYPMMKKVHKSWSINETFLHRYDNPNKCCELMVDGKIIKIPASRRGGKPLRK
jgi:two-component system LytT family response regulator